MAKTSHYWREHLPAAAKEAIEAQERIGALWRSLRARIVGA